MTQKKKIAILGSTGSIGRQTLDVIKQHPDKFEAVLITANNSCDLLCRQAAEFNVKNVVICNESRVDEVRNSLSGLDTKVYGGMKSVCSLVSDPEIDIVVTSMVGFSGLESTIAAIKAGKTIALANKETLVAAGDIVMRLARKNSCQILPVDSEHSAIFQCLQGSHGEKISKIHLTASGGPFRTWDKSKIASATKEQALKHPKWNMGSKITVDSATMMNKGLEIIEARWLFGTEPEKINVIIHPQSIIHSMVEFDDGAVIAQLGHPDMREPIQFALSYPERLELDNEKLDFAKLASLSFYAPDREKFPALALAYKALEAGGNMACIMNAANEAAVSAYLHDRIGFYDITDVIEECMAISEFIAEPDLESIFSSNRQAYSKAEKLIDKIAKK